MVAWILPSDKSFLQVAHLASFLDVLLLIVYICLSSEGQVTLGCGTFFLEMPQLFFSTVHQ